LFAKFFAKKNRAIGLTKFDWRTVWNFTSVKVAFWQSGRPAYCCCRQTLTRFTVSNPKRPSRHRQNIKSYVSQFWPQPIIQPCV